MQPREIFGIVVRIIGFLCLLGGAWRLVEWAPYFLGYANFLAGGVRPQAIFLIGAGLASLRGADAIVRFSYPPAVAQHAAERLPQA